MVQSTSHSPDFGQADLSNCEREQIHLAGSIQPHGALLILREEDLDIIQVSANLQSMLKLERDPLRMRLTDLSPELSEQVVGLADACVDDIPTPLRCDLGSPPRPFETLVHRLPEGGIVVELEPAAPRVAVTKTLESTLQTILSSLTLRELCDDAARIFKDLSGYDRVMVYRFDDDGHGEVFAERREPDLEPYLGNRYPASDIPQIARRLYERNRIRIVVDIDYEPVPLMPRVSPITGRDVDMSLCSLRSTSPIHVQYLKNMGVGATLVISLMSGGRLWGLISCHHYSPRNIPYEIKAVCELLAETVATRIAALESFARTEAELSVRRLEKRMIEGISTKGDWKSALFDGSQGLLQVLGASGAALCYEDQLMTTGEVPGTPQLRAILDWLRRHAPDRVFATSAFGSEAPEFASLKSVVSGLVSTPVSRSPGDMLIWFRPQRVRTVTWGGNPFKPVEVGDDPSQLSPRRSFSQWYQVVKGTSDHWSPTDLVAARMIGESVEDIVYQFRALRILIAQDQLARVRREVQAAAQPVVVLDVAGGVLLVNEAFEQLISVSLPSPLSIEDLPELFGEPSALRDALGELVRDRQPWRGEVRTVSGPGGPRTWLLRADPVFAAVDRVLGHVLFFTDLTDRKTSEAARRRFQEGIVETHKDSAIGLNTRADLVYRNLLSPVIGNAKLAALEITDGMDLDAVPGMLESVMESVSRTASLLERVVSRSFDEPED